MNKAYFKIRNYTIPIIPEITYNDLMDGTPDNMSFSFITDENLSEIINLKEKCEVEIYNKDYPVVGNIDLENNTVTIDDITYVKNSNNNLYLNEELVGGVDTTEKKIELYGEEKYFYVDNIIYLDNRFHYYMCVSQITSEKMSTDADTGYINTVLLNEQTILLKNCIRTDIAITPSLYPQITIYDENGNETKKNVFDTLYDATTKIVDCHNMCVLNDKIENIDDDLVQSLLQVSCPNLTYRDLSTYSQLYDVFMRIGRIPYYEDGTLYGIKLQGDRVDEVYDLNKYSSLSSIKETGVNDNIYSSKVYNNLYDNEYAIVPQIFEDIINTIGCHLLSLQYIEVINNVEETRTVQLESEIQGISATNMYPYIFLLGNTLYGIKVDNLGYPLSYATAIIDDPDNIYFINDTEIKNYKFKINNIEYTIIHEITNRYQYNGYLGSEKASDATTVIPFVNGQPDMNGINKWLNDEFRKWSMLTSQSENDISKTLLFVKGYDYSSKNIEDARNYSLELPYGIELVESIYSCVPAMSAVHSPYGTNVTLHWILTKYDNDKIIENTLYENLSSIQKRITAYYVKGSNKINNVVCLNVPKESNDNAIWDIFEPITQDDYQGAYAWSMTKVYNALRRNFYVVKYKPILNTIYTDYDYHYGEDNKPLSINNFNLPYSQVTDKQVSPVLEYNLEKGLDTTHDVKFITDDINILNVKAGTIVKYNNAEHIVNKASVYINNITFECSFSLTDNIVQNSIISSYADNVRVSSLMSAESVVNRHIHLFGENVIRLMSADEEGAMERPTDYTFFTQEIGNHLSIKGLSQLGLSSGTGSTYTFMSKYPFRFDTILQPKEDSDVPITYIIKASTGSSYDDANKVVLTDADFPVRLYDYVLEYVSISGTSPEYQTNETISYTPSELSTNIYNYAYYRHYWGFIPIASHSLLIVTNGGTSYFIDPPVEYTPTIKQKLLSSYVPEPTPNYRFYYSNKEFDTTHYGTEKMISTSGKITKVEYAFPSTSYVTNTYVSTKLPNISVNVDDNTVQTQVVDDMQILSCTPVLFNSTQYGCKLAGIGNKQSDFYSLYSLPHIFNTAYYLDLREAPRPYIQYKTLGRGSDVIDMKQLSSELEFMKAGSSTLGVITRKYLILRVPKFTNLDNINLPNEYDKLDIETQVLNFQAMSNTTSATFNLLDNITHSDEYDYCLYAYEQDDPQSNEIQYGMKILKFNVKKGHTVKMLCLRSEIYAEL